jgi:hypothetical protein
MTEEPLPPPPDEAPEALVAAPKPPRRDSLPWLYGLGFLVLAAAILYLWQYPSTPNEPAADSSVIQAVQQRLAETDARLNRLEQQPAPDLGKISARIDALEGRLVDQTHLANRVNALEGRLADQTQLADRVNALEGRLSDQTALASRVDALSGRIESLSGRTQTGLDATKQQLDALTSRVAAVESNAGSLDAVTKRLNRIARLQEAAFALAAGRPIGDLPDAPGALARYSHAAPPTEAQLRLRFPRDEQAALAAKQPDETDAPFVGRVWERAQGLITIRRGDEVVVGNPAAIILSRAQVALDAGDIAGAVSAVETLKGPPAEAMMSWLTDAKALVSARAALADMADQA